LQNNFYHLRSAGQAVRESSSQAAGAVARDAGAVPAETSIQQHWKHCFYNMPRAALVRCRQTCTTHLLLQLLQLFRAREVDGMGPEICSVDKGGTQGICNRRNINLIIIALWR